MAAAHLETFSQSLALEQFTNQVVGAVLVANIKYGEKVGMIQRTENSRFLLETR